MEGLETMLEFTEEQMKIIEVAEIIPSLAEQLIVV